jgi:hypothetical protein
MNEQLLPTDTGIEHGPYPDDGTHYSQSTGHFEADEDTHTFGEEDTPEAYDDTEGDGEDPADHDTEE